MAHKPWPNPPQSKGEAWKACIFAPASMRLSSTVRQRLHAHQCWGRKHAHRDRLQLRAIHRCRSSQHQEADCGCKAMRSTSSVRNQPGWDKDFCQRTLCAGLSALLAFTPLQLVWIPSSQAQQQENILENASANRLSSIEESLASLARNVEAKLDSAIGSVSEFSLPGSRYEDPEVAAQGKELINEVWEVIARKYVDVRSGGFDKQKWAQLKENALAKPLRDKASVERAIRSMLAEGISDRFTRYITADQFSKMQSYDITGVGLNLCTASELEEKTDFPASQPGLYVLGLINQSAASRAGVTQGDQILEIDGVTLKNETPFQAASLIQGPETGPRNPTVTLKVRHGEKGELRKFDLQRPIIDNSSPVQAKLVNIAGRKMGQIRVEKFVARTQPDVAAAVTRLSDQGAQEFVLDLRDNLGGLVEEGVEVARLFLSGNVTIVNRLDSGGVRPKTTLGSQALTKAPLTLLVNERTASASEILAGALRDNCRAILVGQRTYGKGLIQSVYQLEDGSALAVTIGKYLTPARTDIDREGIRPDFGSIPDQSLAANTLASCKIPQAA